MEREAFAKVMQEVLDSLPKEFRDRIRNVAVLVEDFPPGQTRSRHPKKPLLGLFHGVPMTTDRAGLRRPPTRRTSKRCVPPRSKSGSKSSARSSTSSDIMPTSRLCRLLT